MAYLNALIDEDDLESSHRGYEADFPVMLLVKGGTSSRMYRCRWASAPDGAIEAIEILCPACSTPIEIESYEVGTFGVLTSLIDCPQCLLQAIALGSPARLWEVLKRRMEAASVGDSGVHRVAEGVAAAR